MKEIIHLHAIITREMEAVVLSVGVLRDSLSSIVDDVSRIAQGSNQEAAQQTNALSNLQRTNVQLLREYQMGLEASRSEDSRDSLDTFMNGIGVAKDHLDELTGMVNEGTRSLVGQQVLAAKEMDASAQRMLASTQNALNVLHTDSQAAWRNMMDAFKLGSSNFHEEVSTALEETMSDIENMATASQEQMEHLNRLVSEFQTKQGDIIWQLRTLHKTLGIFTGMIMYDEDQMERSSSLECLMSFAGQAPY
ncbi:hypothetical protein BGZ65_007050 [Modicella reniformis]|uniref:Uncharacterized protein n=1 Tax=Modicella reniformis TaxID=1440133 RepID=A0A9P6INA1_9FUNG|nr:hypothetical protein BGZ65_007050 [Modicella reniformis]